MLNLELIREKRAEQGLTQKQMAEFLGMSYGTYKNFETGHQAGISYDKMLMLMLKLDLFTKDIIQQQITISV